MIELLNFELCPDRRKIGNVIVTYHELLLCCELVWHVKEEKFWIRMPEHWVNIKFKKRYCSWPNKKISDNFQTIILNKIFDKYTLDMGQIKMEIAKSFHQKKKKSNKYGLKEKK